MDKVSVVIPTYKRCEYLKRAVDSVLAQTYPNMEILVVDDNGVDTAYGNQVAELMRQYADEPRVVYIQNARNVGCATATNIGIQAASGAFISFLDDDDEYMPIKTEAQVSFMKANGLDGCLMDLAGFNEKGEQISEKHHAFPANPTRENLLIEHMLHHLTGTPTFMFRANALREIGGFKEEPGGHEYFLMLKAIECGLSIGHLPEIHAKAYSHSAERISTSMKKMYALSLLLESKKSHFDLLTQGQRRYILCKHHGTSSYLHYMRKDYLRAFGHLASAFIYSPKAFYSLFLEKRYRFAAKGSGH